MKKLLFYTLFSVCLMTVSWTLAAHSQVIVYGSQAEGAGQIGQVAGQSGQRSEQFSHQSSGLSGAQPHNQASSQADSQDRGQAGEQNSGQPAYGASTPSGGFPQEHAGGQAEELAVKEAEEPVGGKTDAQLGDQAGGPQGQQAGTHPFGPPHQGQNAVITITPSTALKSSSQQALDGEEGEENSITQWSSNATKAIVRYQEPEQPKAPTGAPQLRPPQ